MSNETIGYKGYPVTFPNGMVYVAKTKEEAKTVGKKMVNAFVQSEQ